MKLEEKEEERRQGGEFITTNQAEFQKKPIDIKSIGKKRMCNQNGEQLPENARDYDFLSQLNMVSKPALATDAELKAAISSQDYAKQQPITFYTEKVKDGCFYKSEGSNANMFGKKVGKPLY